MSISLSIHDAKKVTVEKVTTKSGCWTTVQIYTQYTPDDPLQRTEIVLFTPGAKGHTEIEMLPDRDSTS